MIFLIGILCVFLCLFGGVIIGLIMALVLKIKITLNERRKFNLRMKEYEKEVYEFILRGQGSDEPSRPMKYSSYYPPVVEIPFLEKGKVTYFRIEDWIKEVYPFWPAGVYKTIKGYHARAMGSVYEETYFKVLKKIIDTDRPAVVNALTHQNEKIRKMAEKLLGGKK